MLLLNYLYISEVILFSILILQLNRETAFSFHAVERRKFCITYSSVSISRPSQIYDWVSRARLVNNLHVISCKSISSPSDSLWTTASVFFVVSQTHLWERSRQTKLVWQMLTVFFFCKQKRCIFLIRSTSYLKYKKKIKKIWCTFHKKKNFCFTLSPFD